MPHTRAENTGIALRNANSHTMKPNRTTSYQQSFFLSTSKLWNHLHESIRSLSYPSFKRAISEQLGVPRPPAYYALGSKTGNILHSRLRTEMTHLNSHLFQLQKHTTAECSCGHPVENVPDFVLSCPNYSAQRIQLVLNIFKIIVIDFCDLSPTYQLHLLLHGGTIKWTTRADVRWLITSKISLSAHIDLLISRHLWEGACDGYGAPGEVGGRQLFILTARYLSWRRQLTCLFVLYVHFFSERCLDLSALRFCTAMLLPFRYFRCFYSAFFVCVLFELLNKHDDDDDGEAAPGQGHG